MAKKNNYTSAAVSFEDFEMALNTTPAKGLSAEELVERENERQIAARKKDAELKKAYQKRKRR